ncbi:hypothetical protein [Dyadobacter sediminis]|uniref:Anti-sigma factor n=1 Tax=Dyadobacter sediminis TaxID=1493691 RepID=A0A5R9KE34_9BACT|nr:hypothetical protein [Dyadobacter sediminis]TLU94363.1 hypothetical protein FEM55_08930 [Dyadobacter sediminis]GGB91929.1 hypothetical protein GCM10011325_19230 [Dyadobacter sediminis]
MNTQDLITSGIPESYLLGLASPEEQELVQQKMLDNPELAAYMANLENHVLSYFDANAVSPPQDVREIVHLRSRKGNSQKRKHVFNRIPKQENYSKGPYLEVEVSDTYIKVHKYWRPAFITVFILSKIFLIAGLYFYFKSSSQEQELFRLKSQIQQIK